METGLYAFPSFKMGSIVKSQNLEFKIPSAQALSIMYGGNKKKGESDSGFNNSQAFDKLFRVGETTGSFNPYADKFLKDLETSNIEVEQTEDDSEFTIKTSPVGSQLSNHNAKITRQDGINITAGKSTSQKERRLYDWKVYSPELSAAGEEKTKGNIQEAFEVRVDDNDNKKILYITSEVTKDGASEKSAVEKSFYEFVDGELVMKSGAQGALNSFLNASSPMSQFDMNSLIPSDLTLEVDGTGGFLPGDIIHTEYIQHKYKANIRVFSDNQQNDIGPLAYFQLFGITQKVSSEGWTTELTSKMRINKLPVGIYRYNVQINL